MSEETIPITRFKEVLKEYGVSQKEIVKATGMAQSNISATVNDIEGRITIRVAHRIATAVGIDVREFIVPTPTTRKKPRKKK